MSAKRFFAMTASRSAPLPWLALPISAQLAGAADGHPAKIID